MSRARTLALTAAVALLLGAVAISASAASSVVISNEFIKIIVNAETSENGRFGVETTGGDPANPNDDNLPLIYGRPVPWTSYTTVRIDGQDWVFGGKASKRAGAGGKYGSVAVAPAAKGSSITTSYMLGNIRATQDLSFARNHMTGYNDTVRIAYTLKNEGIVPAAVGLRLMLDTMLGKNDGAPLRAGESTIVSDRNFTGGTLPDFWQAFDSLAEPSVTSQATLIGKELTPPGSVIFSNWGAFADSLWDVRLGAGTRFHKRGRIRPGLGGRDVLGRLCVAARLTSNACDLLRPGRHSSGARKPVAGPCGACGSGGASGGAGELIYRCGIYSKHGQRAGARC